MELVSLVLNLEASPVQDIVEGERDNGSCAAKPLDREIIGRFREALVIESEGLLLVFSELVEIMFPMGFLEIVFLDLLLQFLDLPFLVGRILFIFILI